MTGLAVGLMIAAFAGFFRLRVETDFSKNFRESSLLVQSLDYFESRLGGVGNWEVHFSAPEELDDESLDRLRALAKDLRELELEDGHAADQGHYACGRARLHSGHRGPDGSAQTVSAEGVPAGIRPRAVQ